MIYLLPVYREDKLTVSQCKAKIVELIRDKSPALENLIAMVINKAEELAYASFKQALKAPHINY